MGRWKGVVLAAALGLAGAAPASAHFLMLHVDSAARMPGGSVDLVLAFAHPFPGAPMMTLDKPAAFYMLRQRGAAAKEEKIDLLKYLEPTEFVGTDEKPAAAFKATLPKTETRSMGDYVLVVEPQPYYEATEDKYIQQFTKTVVNVGGVPGNWDKPLKLPAEIRPLDKPYAVWTGGVFRGVVLANGNPVPFAEIEVQYLNRDVDAAGRGWAGDPKVRIPHPAFETVSLRSDASGTFTVGITRAGWWGIAALAVGPTTTHKGKKLSQDAVLWIQAADVK
ncbi:DUF4198 domain-containing protein [Prosthecomicrobium sp. N25]|uniref:DUF4198 domain-containing protein n=1 Tax=Prosthecomicrobium sp. N25 TaxID=3129254 RepID=UPI003077BBBC